MVKEIKELEIRNIITIEDKQILRMALDEINGWSFNPIAVVKSNSTTAFCTLSKLVGIFRIPWFVSIYNILSNLFIFI